MTKGSETNSGALSFGNGLGNEVHPFASEDVYRAIFNSSFQFIGLLTTDGILTEANGTALSYVGAKLEDVIGKPFWDTPWWSGSESIRNDLREAIGRAAQGEFVRYEVESVGHSGQVGHFDFSIKPVLGKDGRVICLIPEAHDITERYRAETALRENQSLYMALFDGSVDGIAFVGNGGRILECNPSFSDMLGYSPDELKSKTTFDITPEKWHEWEKIEVFEKQLSRFGYAETYEKEYIRKDGSVFPVEVTAYALEQEGSAICWGVVRDISERKRAEEKLVIAQKMDSIGALAGGVAHDFNNMLAGISGYASLLLNSEGSPERRECLDGIMQAVDRCRSLTRKLLEFARRGKGIVQSVDMDRIVEEVIGLLQHTVEKNIRIVSERMPGVAGIDADPAQINQVVMNLAVNAVEAMKDGGTLTFRTRILSETDRVPANEWPEISGNCIMLEVCDTGCGIPDEARHRVFDPFFTTKQDGELKGTGLGLSTAYGIVHSYGGFIRFHSRKGQGTVFQALFPCGALAAGVEGGKSQAHVPPARSVSRILVIDDEEILRRMLREMLESLGYEILDAADGYEGIEMIEKNPGGIHLVILDVKMPRISGSDAFRLIRKADPEIKVLLTTGYGRSQDVQALLDLGANGVIEKPFSLATLGKTVGKLLEDVRR